MNALTLLAWIALGCRTEWTLAPADVAARGRCAIAEMGSRFLLLGPDCSINPDTPEAVMAAAGAAVR